MRRGGLRRWFRLPRVERDVAEELAYHFERSVAELEAAGLTRAEAEREASRRFGDEAGYRRELERIDRGAARLHRVAEVLRGARDTVSAAGRSVLRSPGLGAAVVATLALGVGVNATMFRIADRLWLSPPAHIEDASSVVRLHFEQFQAQRGERQARPYASWPDFEDLAAAASFAGVSATTGLRLTFGHGESAEQVPAELVTGGYFELLGVRPAVGRFFGSAEDAPGAEPVVVVSHGFWQRVLGGARDVVGRTVDFGRGPYTIVGVAPAGFTGTDLGRIDAWLPLRAAGPLLYGELFFTSRTMHWLHLYARLPPGADPAPALAEATSLHRAGRASLIEAGRYDPAAAVVAAPLLAAHGPSAPPEVDVARWLAAVALLVLLVACVNVANLMLARGVRQRREISVRLALGISRRRLVAQLLAEGALLGAVGGALALAIAVYVTPLLGAVLLPAVDWAAAPVGVRVALVTAGLALLAGLLPAVGPALQASRRGVGDALRGSGTGGQTRGTARARAALALAQAALSVVLLVGAALFVRSLDRVRSVDLGWEPRDLLVVHPSFVRGSMTPADRAHFFEEAGPRLARLPAVQAAAASVTSPFGTVLTERVRVPGRELEAAPRGGEAYVHVVGPAYFEAMGMRLRAGRGFTGADRDGAPPVAVINRTLAQAAWPQGGALGQCVAFDAETQGCATVVGIANDPSMDSLHPAAVFQVWLPAAQRPFATADNPHGVVPDRLLVRVRGHPGAGGAAVRRELLAMDARVRFIEARTLHDVMGPVTRSWELGATVFTLFGALALLIAALGLHSVLAFDVAQRTRELGVRAALGASRATLLAGVMRRALLLTAAGTGLGLLAAALLAPRLEPLLFDVRPHDALSFAAAAGALLLVAVAAAALPARSATAADPVAALRAE